MVISHRDHREKKIQSYEGLKCNHLFAETSIELEGFRNPRRLFWLPPCSPWFISVFRLTASKGKSTLTFINLEKAVGTTDDTDGTDIERAWNTGYIYRV